ncbi:MAG: sugar isomerase domain-containing protein [Ktedonobacteraceae bacterium]
MSDQQSSIGLELFWQEASPVLERIYQTQIDAICRAALLLANCIEQDGVVQVYGTGHSRAIAMELSGRAGGLVPINRIDLEDLALYANWPLAKVRSPAIERDREAGQAILRCYRIEAQDVFLIASHSGTNVAIIEVAQRVKEHGHPLVAITSLTHAQQVESRHLSGKKLYELADVVIDNCGPFGDALLGLPSGGKACSISSLSAVLIAQMLTAETISKLIQRGIEPPVFVSYNVPGGIEQGEKLLKRYAGRVR